MDVVQNVNAICKEFNVVGISTSGYSAEKWITK
jgi:hypothetical protein